jgi:hypothetical protein
MCVFPLLVILQSFITHGYVLTTPLLSFRQNHALPSSNMRHVFSPLQDTTSKRQRNLFPTTTTTATIPNTHSMQHTSSRRAVSSSSSSSLHMTLMPLATDEVQRLVAVGVPTAAQYASYWGRTQSEQYGRLLESAIVSFLGVFFSYFLSFVVGGWIATILGALFVFWGILSPQFKAAQRNWELLGGRALVDPWSLPPERDPEQAGLYGSLWLAHVRDICVVEDSAALAQDEYDLQDFQDYTMESDAMEKLTGRPYLLRVLAADRNGRELQIHARLSEEYLDLQPGMPLVGILLSTSPRMDRLAAITDLYIPESNCWIGDYPYLDRAEMQDLLATDDEVWNALQDERVDYTSTVSSNTAPPVPTSTRTSNTRRES